MIQDTVFSMLETVKIPDRTGVYLSRADGQTGNMNLLNTRMHITQMKKHSH